MLTSTYERGLIDNDWNFHCIDLGKVGLAALLGAVSAVTTLAFGPIGSAFFSAVANAAQVVFDAVKEGHENDESVNWGNVAITAGFSATTGFVTGMLGFATAQPGVSTNLGLTLDGVGTGIGSMFPNLMPTTKPNCNGVTASGTHI